MGNPKRKRSGLARRLNCGSCGTAVKKRENGKRKLRERKEHPEEMTIGIH